MRPWRSARRCVQWCGGMSTRSGPVSSAESSPGGSPAAAQWPRPPDFSGPDIRIGGKTLNALRHAAIRCMRGAAPLRARTAVLRRMPRDHSQSPASTVRMRREVRRVPWLGPRLDLAGRAGGGQAGVVHAGLVASLFGARHCHLLSRSPLGPGWRGPGCGLATGSARDGMSRAPQWASPEGGLPGRIFRARPGHEGAVGIGWGRRASLDLAWLVRVSRSAGA